MPVDEDDYDSASLMARAERTTGKRVKSLIEVTRALAASLPKPSKSLIAELSKRSKARKRRKR